MLQWLKLLSLPHAPCSVPRLTLAGPCSLSRIQPPSSFFSSNHHHQLQLLPSSLNILSCIFLLVSNFHHVDAPCSLPPIIQHVASNLHSSSYAYSQKDSDDGSDPGTAASNLPLASTGPKPEPRPSLPNHYDALDFQSRHPREEVASLEVRRCPTSELDVGDEPCAYEDCL